MRLLYAILPPDIPVAFLMLNTDLLVWRLVDKKYYRIETDKLRIFKSFNKLVEGKQYIVRLEKELTLQELRQSKAHLN